VKVAFIVTGPPRTKKNSRDVGIKKLKDGRKISIPLPSRAWRNWNAKAILIPPTKPQPPMFGINREVNCRALFFCDRRGIKGDACGYYQGLADLLEKHGVVVNDRLITQWDGSRVFDAKDENEEPHTYVELEALG
jgi:hypothetical protein